MGTRLLSSWSFLSPGGSQALICLGRSHMAVNVLVSMKTIEELTHLVDEIVEVIFIDQQFGPCPIGSAQA